MVRPALPDSVRVLPGTSVERAWEVFERFEALHHLMAICNPMSSHDVDALVDALGPADGNRMIDLACGHGERLVRLAERADIRGTGASTRGRPSTPATPSWSVGACGSDAAADANDPALRRRVAAL